MVAANVASQMPGAGAGFADIVDRVVKGKPITMDHIAHAAADLFSVFGKKAPQPPPVPPNGQNWAQWAYERARHSARQTNGHANGQQHVPPPPPQQAKVDDIRRARKTLGFGAGEAITPDGLKARHRKLSLKFHPDRGGSPAKMAEINNARDVLAAEIG